MLVGSDADAWLDDDASTTVALADAVAGELDGSLSSDAFHTGSARFDGEWSMGTHQMAALGLAQAVRAHPGLRERYVPALRRASARLADPSLYVFGEAAWGSAPLSDLRHGRGHAYLGYIALALGLAREIDPDLPEARLHDALIEALVQRTEADPLGIVETYPGEAYPCDLASIAGAIGQYDRVTGADHGALLRRLAEIHRTHFVDPASGYYVQAVDVATGAPRDLPRGSGTALGAYFWSFADASLSRELAHALLHRGRVEVLGFGAVREHPAGVEGRGDIDSGPVVLGVSVSATGFALASARLLGERDAFRSLHRTATLFGVPVRRETTTRFLSGGPLGNAILLAMMTARPA